MYVTMRCYFNYVLTCSQHYRWTHHYFTIK